MNTKENSFSHGTVLELEIPSSYDMSLEDVTAIIPKSGVPIYVSQPKLKDVVETDRIVAITTVMKPHRLGNLVDCKPVKVNDSWILHGTLDYYGADAVDHRKLASVGMFVGSIDRIRGDVTSGRMLSSIEKLVFVPYPQ